MRRRKAKEIKILPDPKFNEVVVTKFVNNLMLDGKKSLAFKIFYDAIEMVNEKVEDQDGLDVWKKAIENVTPSVEVRSRRIGGATFQIPMEIRPERKQFYAMSWMIKFARKRNEKSMAERLAFEVLAAYKEEGASIKKKTEVHKMAEANKAFSHFRF